MENEKTTTTPAPLHNGQLTISKAASALAKVVVHVNRFVGFPLDFDDVKAWASDIDRLAPETTPEQLAFLMDLFKTGELAWNKDDGITNIFRNLKRVRRNEEGQWELTRFW